MRSKVTTLTANGTLQNSAAIPLETYLSNFNVTIGVVASGVSGSGSVVIQYTLDEPLTSTPSVWYTVPNGWYTSGSSVAVGSQGDLNITRPVTAFRIQIPATMTSGAVNVTSIQGGIMN